MASWEYLYANPKLFNVREGKDLAANYMQPNEKDEKFTLVVKVVDEKMTMEKTVEYFKSFGNISHIRKMPVS